jgi:uncharacterized protein YbjT (DUF2867 family)
MALIPGPYPEIRHVEGSRTMRVVLFGATGMIGQGVLRECLLAPTVETVLTVGRSATGQRHAKLREVVHADLFDLTPIEADLRGLDACFFCLGISSAGRSEADYRRITYDLTLAAARTLVSLNPDLTFIYVSGQGTDSTERGRSMWARVKGKTENDLLALHDKAYMFRPGFVRPMHGARSRTALYRAVYAAVTPLYPVLRALLPGSVTTTEHLGRAMLAVAATGAPKRVLESREIDALGNR